MGSSCRACFTDDPQEPLSDFAAPFKFVVGLGDKSAAHSQGVDPEGDRWRIRLTGAFPLVAEVTPEAAADLHLAEGGEVFAVIKATEIDVYSL